MHVELFVSYRFVMLAMSGSIGGRASITRIDGPDKRFVIAISVTVAESQFELRTAVRRVLIYSSVQPFVT
jgi:hypothetical protein